MLWNCQLIEDLILFANCREEIDQLELGKHWPVLAVHISLHLVIPEGENLHKAAQILQQWISNFYIDWLF